MVARMIFSLFRRMPLPVVHAHCDGPCGIYDPAAARIAAEAVLSMTQKLTALAAPEARNRDAWLASQNTVARYVKIKEEQAEIAKREILVLWTDYFEADHLKQHPDLHDLFWRAAKLCSLCKTEVNEKRASELLAAVERIHDIFWQTKDRRVAWYTAA
jgi:nickel superoxide dismutase